MMKRAANRKAIVRRLLLAVLGVVLGITVYFANARNVVGNQIPMPFGTGAAVVLSGSMEPTLSKGDLIIVQKTDTVKPGDIVVYQSGSSLIVHRVISVDGDTVVTQGDANNIPDEPLQRSQIKGKVRFHIPQLGGVLNRVRTPAGIAAVLVLAFALVELSFRRERKQDEQKLAEIKDEIRRLKDGQDKKQ